MAIKQGICKICGKIFYYEANIEGKGRYRKYCDGPHMQICSVCGKEFEASRAVCFRAMNGEPIACSRQCQYIRDFTMKHSTKKCVVCGDEFVMKSPKDLVCPKDHYTKCAICGNKFVTRAIDILLEKEKGTCSEECYKELCHKNHVAGSIKGIEKRKQTCLEKYGVDNYFKVEGFQEQSKATSQRKYGVDYYILTDDCNKKNPRRISSTNKKIAEYLRILNIETEFELRIDHNSYDFHILGTNLLLEFDPTIGHNSYESYRHLIGKDPDMKYKPMPTSYHFNKSKIAEDAGYRCIHMFEWDDKHKIANLLIQNKKHISADECEIRYCDDTESNVFLTTFNFYNDYPDHKIKLGLYYNNELYQIMTFDNPRLESDSKFEYEIIRMCTRNDYIIDGGYEKLFRYFKHEYKPKSVLVYCDRSKFTGKTFYDMGFVYNGTTDPKYTMGYYIKHVFCDDLDRYGYRSFIDTDKEYDSNFDAMIDNKYRPVYDCGWMKFYYSSIV